MDESYKTVLSYGSDEHSINKSKFIGYAMPINSEEEAIKFIEKIKDKHKDATHNIYAYVVGKNSNIQRFSDDGEPSGTAGVPALEVIKKENLENVVVVITRYFGGVKLGGGGLIRAYTRGAKIAIDAAKIVNMTLHRELGIKLDYSSYGKIENYLLNHGHSGYDINFGENIDINLFIRKDQVGSFKEDIWNFTNGEAIIEEDREIYLPILRGKTIFNKP